jgi:outer membrane murein-binding lipoprotein Lpp
MTVHRPLAAAFALALVFAGSLPAAHAQQDLKPLQADVDNLKQQVSRLQSDLSAAKSPALATKPAPSPTLNSSTLKKAADQRAAIQSNFK